MNPELLEWIAADWGTTHLRCWAMSSEDRILAQAESDRGMSAVVSEGGDFEAALLDLIEPWLQEGTITPVALCGMAGARQGWIEAPYNSTPCSPSTGSIQAPVRDPRLSVSIQSGLQQDDPPDVMRGEETQIAGLLQIDPGFEGLACLPGTHTKWATVRGGQIRSFRTALTGELFSLLAEQSILRLTLASEGWDQPSFLEAVRDSLRSPEFLFTECFRLRAASILHSLDGIAARSRLSGLLIGHELAGEKGELDSTARVALIGSDHLTPLYASALAELSIEPLVLTGEEALLSGLAAARRG